MVGMEKIGKRGGSIIFPEQLTLQQQRSVCRLLGRHNIGLVNRIDAFSPIRLKDCVGTEILIREKGRR